MFDDPVAFFSIAVLIDKMTTKKTCEKLLDNDV